MPDHDRYPPHSESKVCHVGTYRRVLPVSLDRMYENALDWEHLPYVHADSFTSIECLDAGPWGWRARVANANATGQSPADDLMVIELRLDRALRRWITRTLEGPNEGSEIWTHAFSVQPRRVDIVVDFFVPGVAAAFREKVGQAYAELYTRLYDEDVAMMTERQRRLDTRVESYRNEDRRLLGLRPELGLPVRVDFAGRPFVVAEVEGELIAYSALCPHQLGPLHSATLVDSEVSCPWHGYRFDVSTGRCLSGQGCVLPTPPVVVEDAAGQVFLELSSR